MRFYLITLLCFQTLPWWVRWIWYCNPVSWGLYGIIITQMGNVQDNVMLTDGTYQTIQEYLGGTYGYHYSFRWPVVGIILGFTVAFLVGAVMSLRTFNFQTR